MSTIIRWLHGALAQQRGRFGRCHELDQVTRHSLVLRNVAHCDAEVTIFDQLGRQGAEIGRAGDRLDYIGLLDTDLDLALRDSNRHRFTRDDFDLVLDLIVDAKLLEKPRVVRTGSGVAVADRFGVQHCLLETLGGTDIWYGCSRLYGNAITGAGKLDHGANHLTVLDDLVKCGHEIDHQVTWRIGFDLLLLLRNADEIDHDFVAGRVLVACRYIAHAGQRPLIDQNRDLGCLCRHGCPCGQRGNEHNHGYKPAFHDVVRSLSDSIANGISREGFRSG